MKKCKCCNEEMKLIYVFDDPDKGFAYNVYSCESCFTLCRENVWDYAGDAWIFKEDRTS